MPQESPADQVRQFVAWLAPTDIEQLELRTPQGVLRVRRGGGAVQAAETAGVEPAPVREAMPAIAAPSLGIFLHQHPLHDAPLAGPGAVVRAGQTVGFLRIGALLLPVSAAHDGVVADVPASHGGLVGYGETLIRLRRE